LDAFILSCIHRNQYTQILLDYYASKQKRRLKLNLLETEINRELYNHNNFNGTGKFKGIEENNDNDDGNNLLNNTNKINYNKINEMTKSSDIINIK